MGLFDNIFQGINAGINVLNSTRSQGGNSSHPNIIAAIDDIVRQMNQLEVGFAALPPATKLQNGQAALQAADAIIAALNQIPVGSNGNYISTSQRIFADVRTHIQQMIVDAQNIVNGTTPTNTTTTPTGNNTTPVIDGNGQIVYVQTPSTGQLINGVDNSILVIGGIAVVALFLFKK